MAYVLLHKTDGTMALLLDFLKKLDSQGSDAIRMVRSSGSFDILLDEKNLGKLLETYSENKVKEIMTGVGVVTVYMTPELAKTISKTSGIYAHILNELAVNDINIIGNYSCFNEFMVFVDDKDLLKAYETLMKMCGS